ncbi:MAG TPA: hypothetical protein DD444_03380 [Citreicella sp.]|jgi:aerobic carbon-monoxide dehydrogenase medium subunit|nr:hypothetical protein [Citreicella sp.]
MKPAPFTYYRPTSLEDAAQRLRDGADDGALILAGGQSLVPMMALRVAYATELIDLNALDGLDRPRVEGDSLVIPTLTRHATFHDARAAPAPLGDLLACVAAHIAHYPIRQRGTFGGSLSHADPSSEWCLVTATLDGTVCLLSADGPREVAARDWSDGPMSTTRDPDEILTEVRLPLPEASASWGFYEFNRRAGDFALGMALCVINLQDDRITAARIGIGGIEDHPRRLPEAEAALIGRAFDAAAMAAAAEAAMRAVDPMEDATTSAEYRRDLTGTVITRALEAARLRTLALADPA